MLVGLELEHQCLVAFLQHLVLLSERLVLCLHTLVPLLEIGDQLLELHAANLGLHLFNELLGHLILLANQVTDENEHKVNEKDSTLHNVFLGLWQALGRVPSGAFEEDVVDAAVQFTVQLAEVLAAIALGNAVLLPLIIWIWGDHAPLALAAAELLQGGLAVDILWGDQGQDFALRELIGPFEGSLGGK